MANVDGAQSTNNFGSVRTADAIAVDVANNNEQQQIIVCASVCGSAAMCINKKSIYILN